MPTNKQKNGRIWKTAIWQWSIQQLIGGGLKDTKTSGWNKYKEYILYSFQVIASEKVS